MAGRIDEDKIIESMSDEVALIILPTVLYRSGQLLNIEKVTKQRMSVGFLLAGMVAIRSARFHIIFMILM